MIERMPPYVRYSVVVPVYNSSQILPSLHERLLAACAELDGAFELIFVDDSSPDESWAVLAQLAQKDPRMTAVQLMKNVGQGSATVCGLSRAHGSIIVTLDDDLQHPPEEIPRLVALLERSPEVDVILAIPQAKQHGFLRRAGSWAVNRMNSLLLNKPTELRFSSFRVLRAPVAREVCSQRVLRPALGPVLLSVTDRIMNRTVEHHPRAAGSSGYTVGRLIAQTMSNAIGYSMLPLRLLAMLGALGIVASGALATIYLLRYLSGGIGVPGFTTQALLMTALFGFNFFAFGVLGEYVLRILQLSSSMQLFAVRKSVGTGAEAPQDPTEPR